MGFDIGQYAASTRLTRHRHMDGYIAITLSGGYVEAGKGARMKVGPGSMIVHSAYDMHQDEFGPVGAVVLNLPLICGTRPGIGRLPDPDVVARIAEHDPLTAAELACATMLPNASLCDDWPDLLAIALTSGEDIPLRDWAAQMGIAPQSLSRGFRRAYGVSPKRYRLEQRSQKVAHELSSWGGSLAVLAVDGGFSDQAHMTRSIRALTGSTPTKLRVQSVQS